MRRSWLTAGLALIAFGREPRHQRPATDAVEALRLTVNIPAFRVDVYDNDTLVQRMRVAVGQPGYETPRGTFGISSVEWNPWWIPPDRPWAANQRPQPPGPTNPMGRVKINFRPLYFLHGTPLDGSIGSAASHGCVRMHTADAIALARMVLAAGAPALAPADIDRLAADTRTTKLIELPRPVPITLVYDRVELIADSVFVYRDIYRLSTRSPDLEVRAVLEAHGVDPAFVDSVRLRRFVDRIPAAGRSIALRELLEPPASRGR